MEQIYAWSHEHLGQWHYVLGYGIGLVSHNWPVMLTLVMTIRCGFGLYRTPTRGWACWLFGWLLLGLAYEYWKHVAAELHAAVDFLAIGELYVLNGPLHLVVSPALTALLLAAALGFWAQGARPRLGAREGGTSMLRDQPARAGAGAKGEENAMDDVPGDCTVVVPTYNERENIAPLIEQVLANPRFRVLVVDDGSPDGTGQLVGEIAAREPRVRLLSRSGKLGLGTAYIAGFRQALRDGAQYIFEMDADFSHDPAYLPVLLAAAESRFDLAMGSRYVRGGRTTDWGLARRMISQGGNLYAGLILSLPTRDSTSGFRCYRRKVLEALDLDAVRSNGYAFQIEMVYRTLRGGFRVGEIPITFPDRRVGASKMSGKIVIEALVNVWHLRFARHVLAEEISTIAPQG